MAIASLHSNELRRKRWTRPECEALENSGILNGQNVELIDGELIDKTGTPRPHVHALALLAGWLTQVFGVRFVNLHAPIYVAPEDNPTNEPQPDAIVLRPSFTDFETSVPHPADLLLVVEISDSSLAFDRTVKAALYARAGIVEYWIVDVAGRRLLVHRDPSQGRYATVHVYDKTESVSPLAKPEAKLAIASLFPVRPTPPTP